MRNPRSDHQLDVAGLLAHGSLRTTTPLFVTPSSAAVDGVVLIAHLDAIHRVRPNTVIVLSAEMGSSGWLVSAALRQAWERGASAVVVAGSMYSRSAIGLAERLGITLLSADEDTSGVALALAAEIGAAISVTDARLARFGRTIANDTNLGKVLSTISRELDGIELLLQHGAVTLASAGPPAGRAAESITVEVHNSGPRTLSTLTARVPRSSGYNLRLVRSILEVATPSVRAAWLLENVLDSDRAVPTAALVSLDQAPASAANDFMDRNRNLLIQLGWKPEERYAAIWISGEPPEGPARDLTAVLRLLWRKVTVRSPLAEVEGGWLALAPAEYQDAIDHLEKRIRVRIGSALSELGLAAGLSSWREEATAMPNIIRESRLAAESALSAGPGTVAGFAGLDIAAAVSFIDENSVLLVAELTLPLLMTSPDRDAIIAGAAAFLDHHGSISLAASSLNLHRNTLLARLNRAREVGIPLDVPAKLLSVHIILTMLRRSIQDRAGSNTTGKNQKGLP